MADRNKSANQADDRPSVEDQFRALYEQAESNSARLFEEVVAKPSFGLLLARSAENIAALTRIGSDVVDLVLRNLRIAGRADVTRLSGQLHRAEDKLEQVLQEVEGLRDDLARRGGSAAANGGDPAARLDRAEAEQ